MHDQQVEPGSAQPVTGGWRLFRPGDELLHHDLAASLGQLFDDPTGLPGELLAQARELLPVGAQTS